MTVSTLFLHQHRASLEQRSHFLCVHCVYSAHCQSPQEVMKDEPRKQLSEVRDEARDSRDGVTHLQCFLEKGEPQPSYELQINT